MCYQYVIYFLLFQTLSSPLRLPTSLSPVPPVITDERFNLLCPQPKHMNQLSDEQNFFPDRMTISISPGKHSIHEYVWQLALARSITIYLNVVRTLFESGQDSNFSLGITTLIDKQNLILTLFFHALLIFKVKLLIS